MTFQITAGTMIDDRYRVISRVGSGGMAEVYCAEDTQLGRRVAVKLLHERFAQDAEFVERFRREASSAASLSHANIVSVYDRGEWGGTYYIAMEFLDGRSLDSIVREQAPLAPERAIELTEQVLRAARFAHRRNVVHRDLKPHNVLIDDEGRVKVTDFGIARAGASEITQTGSIMGTARYLSPEQAQGHAVGAPSDLYAIGIMLYELLTGTVPFEGDSVVAIALRHLSEPPRPPSTLVPTISPNLDAIVMRALEKDPARRFADADEFLGALEAERERLRHDAGSHTAAITPVSMLPGPAAYSHPATYTTQPIGPIGPATGVYGTAPAYWDPHTTGIIPPGSIVLPPGSRERRPVWPWALLGLVAAAAAIAALVIVLVHDRSPKVVQVRVPNVVGLSKADAQATLADYGFHSTVAIVPSRRTAGTVLAEVPSHGVSVPKGSAVRLRVSGGPAKPTTGQVPNVLNVNAATATGLLHNAGFRVSPVKRPSTSVPKNDVISTNPPVGSSAAKGSTVVMTISTGPPRIPVPNVVDETLPAAKLLLQQRGFVVAPAVFKTSTSQQAGTVLAQSPSSGKALKGSTVTLTVAKAPAPVTLPRLLGLTEAQASARLGKLGLVPQPQIEVRHRNPQYDGVVISQQPPPNSTVAAGSTVVLGIESYEAPVGPTGPTGPSGPTGVT